MISSVPQRRGPVRVWVPLGVIILAGAGSASWLHFRAPASGSPPPTPPAVLYSRWLKGFEPVAPEAATSDLAALVLSSDGQRLCKDVPEVAELERDKMKPDDLCRLEVVRRLVKDRRPDPYALLSDQYRSQMQQLTGQAELTPEQVVKIRQALNGLGDAWDELREAAARVPRQEDTSLLWLDLLLCSRSGDLPEVILPPRPVLPFFGDREGLLVRNLEIWLNLRAAQRALTRDRDQYSRLYRDDRIPPLPKDLIGYRARWSADIEQELERAIKDRPDSEAAQLRGGYFALLRFLNRFADQLTQL